MNSAASELDFLPSAQCRRSDSVARAHPSILRTTFHCVTAVANGHTRQSHDGTFFFLSNKLPRISVCHRA